MASCISFSILALSITLLLDATSAGTLEFGYSGTTGPDKWGSMSKDWKACSVGKQQSPVDISKNTLMVNNTLKPLHREYKSANATLVNFGYSIALRFEENGVGAMTHDGKRFTLKQLHWHTPAEHLIDGYQHPAELHLVHRADADDSAAVVSVLLEFGNDNRFVKKIMNGLRKLAKEVRKGNEPAEITLGDVDTKALTKPSDKFYKYMGSLTTPPCTENILWVVLDKVEEISNEQIEFLQAPLGKDNWKNARPVQPLNGRRIELYQRSSPSSSSSSSSSSP